jgi:hypothetical protein
MEVQKIVWIMVAGPYSASTREGRAENLRQLNQVAHEVYLRGHIPVVGVNAALPVAEAGGGTVSNEVIMGISLALADRCDALLLVASSPGADREAERMRARGCPIYRRLNEIPPAAS